MCFLCLFSAHLPLQDDFTIETLMVFEVVMQFNVHFLFRISFLQPWNSP